MACAHVSGVIHHKHNVRREKKYTPKRVFSSENLSASTGKKQVWCIPKMLVFKGKRRKINIHQRGFKVFVGDPFAQYWCIDFGLLNVIVGKLERCSKCSVLSPLLLCVGFCCVVSVFLCVLSGTRLNKEDIIMFLPDPFREGVWSLFPRNAEPRCMAALRPSACGAHLHHDTRDWSGGVGGFLVGCFVMGGRGGRLGFAACGCVACRALNHIRSECQLRMGGGTRAHLASRRFELSVVGMQSRCCFRTRNVH